MTRFEFGKRPSPGEIAFGTAVQQIANEHTTIAGGLPSRDLRELGRRTLDAINRPPSLQGDARRGYFHALQRLADASGKYPEIGAALWRVLDRINEQFPSFLLDN
jgi:hypothetical protein